MHLETRFRMAKCLQTHLNFYHKTFARGWLLNKCPIQAVRSCQAMKKPNIRSFLQWGSLHSLSTRHDIALRHQSFLPSAVLESPKSTIYTRDPSTRASWSKGRSHGLSQQSTGGLKTQLSLANKLFSFMGTEPVIRAFEKKGLVSNGANWV